MKAVKEVNGKFTIVSDDVQRIAKEHPGGKLEVERKDWNRVAVANGPEMIYDIENGIVRSNIVSTASMWKGLDGKDRSKEIVKSQKKVWGEHFE